MFNFFGESIMRVFPSKAAVIISSACFVLLNLVSVDAGAVDLIWNSGVWGDTWQSDVVDTDGDGISDIDDLDDDNDGLSDLEEAGLGTNPLIADTDGDGLTDGEEVIAGRNPLVNEAAVIIIILGGD